MKITVKATMELRIPGKVKTLLNESQYDSLVNYLLELDSRDDQDNSLDNIAIILNNHGDEEARDILIDTAVIPYNTGLLDRQISERIDNSQWTVMHIGGSNDLPPFTYTVGLTQVCGREIALSGISSDVAHTIVNDLGAVLAENPLLSMDDLPTSLIKIKTATGYVDGRLRYEEASLADAVKHTCFMVGQHVVVGPDHKLLVIILPDAENLLPGEEGYNEAFNQFTAEDYTTDKAT